MTSSPSPVKRSIVPPELVDENAQRRVILAQHQHHFLGFGDLGKTGKPAQVTEQDGDVAAMAFQHTLMSGGDHEPRYLGGKKPAPDAIDFGDLFGHALLKGPIQIHEVGRLPQHSIMKCL
jgi:hypothetical protein